VTAESFQRAVTAAMPGQTLLLADGVYRDVKWSFSAKGALDKPITLRAQTPGKVIIVGQSELIISGEHLVVSGLVFDQAWGAKVVELSRAKHCWLTDCAFVACGSPRSTFAHVVYLVNGSASNRVDHCYFEGSLSMSLGTRIHDDDFANSHNRFDHNFFKDIIRRASNGQEAVQLGQNKFSARQPMHVLVEHNLFDNASGDGEIVCNKSCCNTIRFNTFTNCRGSISLRSGGSALVQGNVLLNCNGGVRVHATHSVIFGNRIEGCDEGMTLAAGNGPAIDVDGHTTANHCVFANNVVRNCKTAAIRIGHHQHSDPKASQVPFANVFVNNVLTGNTGELVRFDAPNDQVWRATSVRAEGKAKPGAQPAGVKVEQVAALQAERVAEFKADLAPILAAMMCPRSFEEVCPAKLEVKVLEPREVGPTWMRGDPRQVPRVGERKLVPDPSNAKLKRKA
jgi:poly(beta-D-mannuronate) lyase